MRSFALLRVLAAPSIALMLVAGCAGDDGDGDSDGHHDHIVSGPGAEATDARRPELGKDPTIVRNAKLTLVDGIAQTTSQEGPVIEAKFELDDAGALSLSAYPVKSMGLDAERNVFQELSGDPTKMPFEGGLEAFTDPEHLTRSSRDLTLVQLSKKTVADAIGAAPSGDFVFWSIPTIRAGRAGFGVYSLTQNDEVSYRFVDGGGDAVTGTSVEDLGSGPGGGATDARGPELGEDVSIVLASKVSLADALAADEAAHGPAIEAKFELGDDGSLSLSIYPVADLSLDAERNAFSEVSGDPTASPFAGGVETFESSDVEHLTRSARDLTLVQTAGLTLRNAVDLAQKKVPGGFVFWAIPTMRGTRSGYGVYVYGTDGKAHYLFVS